MTELTAGPSEQMVFSDWREHLVEAAIETLRFYAPTDAPYWGAFSGGKDSVVIKELARLAGVAVEWHYSMTTIDPPELVRFIREKHPDVIRDRAAKNFFSRIVESRFPTRRIRWCCEEYKETKTPKGRRLILGVRSAEGVTRRQAWSSFTHHKRTGDYAICPIVHWHDDDVWWFIRTNTLPYCVLYDEGFTRLGCIGCPMAGAAGRKREFARWPRFQTLWREAFRKLWERRAGTKQRGGDEWFGSAHFSSWEAMWEWWLNDEPISGQQDECDGQTYLWS
jgi:phosphoadenosine phosphosulfate reductase